VSRGDLLRLFLRICDAVGFAHARGIIHRDLKPGNVMVGEYGEAFVLDWGIAKSTVEASHTSEAAGTPGFMAPEQAAGDVNDVRVDVYGLGAMLRDLLSRQAAPVPRPLAAIAGRATALRPADRYASVGELADDVRRWLDDEPVKAYPENLLERGARLYQRHQLLILLLAAYAMVRVAILLTRGI
jgi:serine/threonine-protein kinase